MKRKLIMKTSVTFWRPETRHSYSCIVFEFGRLLFRRARLCVCALAVTWLACATARGVETVYEFRMPGIHRFAPVSGASLTPLSAEPQRWVRAFGRNGRDETVEFGDRVVLQLAPNAEMARVMEGSPLRRVRSSAAGFHIFQAADAPEAMREAHRLSALAGVEVCYPVIRRTLAKNYKYDTTPNDPYFRHQWNYENRDANGVSAGPDMNLRGAWPIGRGAGVLLAVVDDGIELTHPDLADRVAGAPHYNFYETTTNGLPESDLNAHGTAVAGLAGATGNNGRGIIGAAPEVQLASWVIFGPYDESPADDAMAAMFEYQMETVSVENHSWAHAGIALTDASPLEKTAVSNAVHNGRGGRGVFLARAAGNGRSDSNGDDILQDANDDGYNATPEVSVVAAVRSDGRIASYSNQGACILVAAPSDDGDLTFPTIFSTDRLGSKGYNQISFTNDLADYCFDSNGFGGTSAATPQISGLAALLLSVNSELGYRDLQQILALSARHFDAGDPELQTNGAGFLISHNDGFGVPDGGAAARLAKDWTPRPAQTNVTLISSNETAIAIGGLRLLITGDGISDNITNVAAEGANASYPDAPTGPFPLVDVGGATNDLTIDLHGKAALIQRGDVNFSVKIDYAAKAGAALAVVYDNRDGTNLHHMGGTDHAAIPSAFIDQNDGEAILAAVNQGKTVNAQFQLMTTDYSFQVTNALILEQVAVRCGFDYPFRPDLRVTLVSPHGTRSILQHYNSDASTAPTDWTFVSTQHFFEGSAGTWTLSVSGASDFTTGSVTFASLTLYGVAIKDSDGDGLDDDWEMAQFGTLAHGPADDPDRDGYSNAREQLMRTNPAVKNEPLAIDLSMWNDSTLRLSWPGVAGQSYELWTGDSATQMSFQTNLTGRFPEMQWFESYTNKASRFFEIHTLETP
jgi:subtilisin family serine protease/subtilisin-like proprotein convertase family protein